MTRTGEHNPADTLSPFGGVDDGPEWSNPSATTNRSGVDAEGPAHRGRQRRVVRWIGIQLMLMLILLFFVPMPGNAEDGNAFFRLLIFGILAIAILAVIERPMMAADLFRRLWPLSLLLVWLLVTSRWATYTDISVRRGFAYVLIFAIAISLAVSFDRPRDLHRPLFIALGAVFMVNLVSADTTAPIDAAMGVNGIYAQKNGAGALALYLILASSSAVVLYRRFTFKLLPLVLAVLGWSFLVSTRAKTSMATAALLTPGLPLLGYLLSRPVLPKALVASALGLLVGAALFMQHLLGITSEQVGQAVFGDLTFTNRTFLWDSLYPEIARHPWTGVGFGSFWGTGQLLNPIRDALPNAFFMAPDVVNEAHNGYIDITLQAGYVGLGLTIFVILRAVRALCAVIGTPRMAREDRIVCTMLLGFVLALVVSNCTESQIFSPSNPIGYMFVVIAVQAERWRAALGRELIPVPLRIAPGSQAVNPQDSRSAFS